MVFNKKTFKAAYKAAFLFMALLAINGCIEETKEAETEQIKRFNNPSNKETNNSKDTSSNEIKLNTTLSFSSKFDAENTQPQSSFDCDQKIYAVVLLENYPQKTHNIVINWIDPYNKQRESTEIPTYVSRDQVYTWSSLSLHRDITAGMLQWINPAAGMEEFIGEWHVKVMIDNELVKSEKFTVVC